MKQVTITVDERKYGVYTDRLKSLGISGEDDIIEGLEDYVKIWSEPGSPNLRVVGKEPDEKPKVAKNIISLGIKPRTTEITLDIENELYEELSEIAQKAGKENAETVIRERADAYVNLANEPPNEMTYILHKAVFGTTLRPELLK
jgi:hypothetical protein